MASLMKYVNNNFNQLPSYCFAEENLTDRCQTTSTEEIHAVPLVSPKETLRDNNTQTPPMRPSVRPPPGFAPLDEQSDLLKKSNFCNGTSKNTPNEKTPAFGATETNPFLYDDQPDDIPNDIAKTLFVRIWTENQELQSRLTEMFSEILECTPLSRTLFDNHMTVQCRLNRILKSYEKAMKSNNEQFLKPSFNPSKETISSDVSSVQETPVNSNNEVFRNQGTANYVNTYLPNVFNIDAQTSWSQPDQYNPYVQVPTTTASSIFSNYQLAADFLFSNTSQKSDNVPATQLTNSGLQYTNVIKETNPFKLYMTGNTEMPKAPESQQTATSCDLNSGYLPVQNLPNHISKIATSNIGTNFHATNNNSAEYVNGNENYSPRIVYEAGPVMYNTQKQQANADARRSTCNNNLNVPQKVPVNLGRDGTRLPSSSVNNVAVPQLKQNDILHNNEACAIQSPTDCIPQASLPIINEELNYYQQNQANIPRPVSACAWKQVEISEHWLNSKFQNNVCLQDYKQNCATDKKPVNSSSMPFQDWNYNNVGALAFPNMNGTIDPHTYNNNTKEKLIDVNMHSWNIYKNQISNISNIFIFQKIGMYWYFSVY